MAKRGRPTSYSPAYCAEVVAAGDEGLSLTAFAGIIGVARSTINEWEQHFPDFSEAIKKHKAKRALMWERRLARQADGASGKPVCTIFALKNLAAEDWKDTQVIAGDPNAPLAGEIDAREVARRVALLLTKAAKE